MSTIIKLDEKRRGVFPEPFKPGDTLSVDVLGPDSVCMRLVKPAEVPIAEPRWVNGRMFGARVELDQAEIAVAVRAERDER